MNNKELLQAAVEEELIKYGLNVSFGEATQALIMALCSLAGNKYSNVITTQKDGEKVVVENLRTSFRDAAELGREFKKSLQTVDTYQGIIAQYYANIKEALLGETTDDPFMRAIRKVIE